MPCLLHSTTVTITPLTVVVIAQRDVELFGLRDRAPGALWSRALTANDEPGTMDDDE